MQFTIKKLYNAAYEEFRHGNDRIGERTCEDFNEYWTYFLLDVVYPATETYNEETFQSMLDEGDKICNESIHIGKECVVRRLSRNANINKLSTFDIFFSYRFDES